MMSSNSDDIILQDDKATTSSNFTETQCVASQEFENTLIEGATNGDIEL
ncbi:hypothetical protein B566_EDAN014347, partial [Ephemera danica]